MFKKTGTTIVGLKFLDGVILATDTRSTIGNVVEDKNCMKLHKLTDKIFCAGAGTSADADALTRQCEHFLSLFTKKYNKTAFVNSAKQFLTAHLHKYNGNISAALILGGVDSQGIHLYGIHPHGSSSPSEFTSLGSGSLAAISVLETGYRRNMSEEEAVELASKAVEAGIMNDLYSGSNVDYIVIKSAGAQFHRNSKIVACKTVKDVIKYPLNSIKIQKEEVMKYIEECYE